MLLWLLDTFIWAVALVGVLVAWTLLWRRALRLDDTADEIHFVTTADGWRLGIGRHLPRGEGTPNARQVILCHGLGANRFNMDFGDRHSLARHLAEAGYECWVPELRGAGRSTAPPGSGGRAWAWDFDTLVSDDVPAILDLALERSGADAVHWVGHSLGGLVMYAHLSSQGGDPRVASLFAIASPGDGTLLRPSIRTSLSICETLSRWRSALHFRAAGGLVAPFGGILARAPQPGPISNPENMAPWVARRACAHLATDINLKLMRQMASWAFASEPGFSTHDGRSNYLAGLKEVTTPAFFAAGAADGIVIPDSVRAAFDAWGGEASEFRIFGRNHGDSVDYGHGDLLLGVHARDEVFPRIRDWLLRQDDPLEGDEGPATSP